MSEPSPSVAGLTAEKRRALARLLDRKGIGGGPAQEIPRRASRESPVSFAQQRLWLLDRLEPGSPRYNVFTSRNLVGRLDVEALTAALGEIVDRHEILRARLEEEAGTPVQRIGPVEPPLITLVDLADRPVEARASALRRLALSVAQDPYDLTRGTLYRFGMVRTAAERHILLIGFHHVVSDAWSVGVVLDELAALYGAFREGRPSPLPELPIQYADFAAWQREWLKGPALERQLSYWRRRLEGLAPFSLATDHPRPATQGFEGAVVQRSLGGALSSALRALSQREGVTPFMTLLAAFQVLLHRYTGEIDIAVGSPVANRSRAELEGLVGFFVNMLVMRTNLSGDPSFKGLLRRVRDTALGALSHQDLPFEKLVSELAPDRDLSRNPIFQVSFVFQQESGPWSFPGDLRLEADTVDNGVSKFDLSLYISEEDEDFVAAFEYSTDLFERETVERMVGHFQTLLEGIAADPQARLSDLPLCAETERREVLLDWNETFRALAVTTLHERVEAQVERTPDAIAVAFAEGRLSYRELNRRANRLANRLRGLGVGPESLVGLFLERGPETLVGLLAVLKAGGAYLPLDPSFPVARVASLVEDAGARIVLTVSGLHERLPRGTARLCLDHDVDGNLESEENPLPLAGPENLAYVIYTSGSTGRPKGVMIPHRGLVNYLSWAADAYAAGEGWSLVHSPLGFDLTVTSLLLPLLGGHTVELLSEGGLDVLAARLQDGGEAGLLKITPAHLEALRPLLSGGARWPRLIVVGGEALSGEALNGVRTQSPDAWIVNEYGPTETVVGCCVHRARVTDVPRGPVPIGRPIDNTRLYVVDPHLNPVPVGVPGELLVGGAGVARGYWNRPELTAEWFVPDPFGGGEGARLYRTGDRVRRKSDGSLEYLGRLDAQLKLRGYRIEPGEIEAALAEHPGVRQSAVMVREDRPGDRRLVAYVVGAPTLEPSSLGAALRARLPGYLVPSAFVVLRELPLTDNGKVDLRALPPPEDGKREEEPAAPRTPLEKVVAAAFGQVLGLEHVGAHDSFFGLGGHSLLATQVVSRLRDSFRAEVPLRLLFEKPTVSALASALESDPNRGTRFAQVAEVLLRIAHLSENEAERMLAERDRLES